MMPDPVILLTTIILLLPMGYFLLAAPAFLLVKLDIPAVAQLLRGMFNGYFLMVAIAAAVGTIAVAVTGRLFLAVGVGSIATFAILARRWFLRQMDAELRARDAGDSDAMRRLRRLHWGGHAVQCGPAVRCREQRSLCHGGAGLIAPLRRGRRTQIYSDFLNCA